MEAHRVAAEERIDSLFDYLHRSENDIEKLKREMDDLSALVNKYRAKKQQLLPEALVQWPEMVKEFEHFIRQVETRKAEIEIFALNIKVEQERTRSTLEIALRCPRNGRRG